MIQYIEPLAHLVNELTKLPGIGPKTAQRLAFHILRQPREQAVSLAEAIIRARDHVRECSVCRNLTDVDPCRICRDQDREHSVVCVVEDPQDVMALERVKEFRGTYHVLHGTISPMEGVGPDQIRIKELLTRVSGGKIKEVILATNADVEGDVTAMYIAKVLKPLGVKVTRLAYGLPVGGDLEYVGEVTLSKALEGRRVM